MIPVDQVRTGAPAGQCTEASIASILEVPLEAVPDIWAGPNAEEHRPDHLWVRLLGFVMSHGYQWVSLRFPRVPLAELDLDTLGIHPQLRVHLEGFHGIGGYNPDGLGHMVVGQAGRLVHDPNPSRRGVVEVDELVVLVPLDQVPEHLLGWAMRAYRLLGERWTLVTAS